MTTKKVCLVWERCAIQTGNFHLVDDEMVEKHRIFYIVYISINQYTNLFFIVLYLLFDNI